MMKERRYVLRNGLVFDTKENKKMYPVGKWNKYQHVFYNYMDRCFNSMCESEYDKKESDKYEKSQELAGKWDYNPQVNGIVYAYYEDYKMMKDVIGGYAWRHNGYV